ncbi:MAG: hypothetical protein ACTSWX_14305 [Promethearchaeota archaeon]
MSFSPFFWVLLRGVVTIELSIVLRPFFAFFLLTSGTIKWLADNFYDHDFNRLNNHVNEIGTPGTELYNLIYTDNANLREFTGVKYLMDLPHRPVFYKSTRTGKKFQGFQLNELSHLVPIVLKSASHFEKGSLVQHGKYTDMNGHLHYVPFNILGDTMLMINLDDNLHNIYFHRDFPENYFSKIRTTAGKKEIRGDKARYLGIYWGNDGLKAFFYESAGVIKVKYLSYKPFNNLALRAQFHLPLINILPGTIGTTIPTYVRNYFTTSRDLKHILPRYHYILNQDGSVTMDSTFYYPYGRHQIPSKCTLHDFYQDIAFEGNGYIIDEIIAQGGPDLSSMLQKSSWYPNIPEIDQKLLGEAQSMCQDLGIHEPFEHYKDFFKFLMTIDWTVIGGMYITDYNNRLGLTEEQARRLVEEHGFIWNDDPNAPLQYLGYQLENNPVENFWTDFENMYNPEGKTTNDEKQWMQMVFYYMYQHMTSEIGSGQVHLMFNPQQFNQQYSGWTDPANIAVLGVDKDGNEIWEYWLYPGNPSQNHLPEMSYFPISFFTDLLKKKTFSVGNTGYFVLDLQTWLKKNWERLHPEHPE